MTRRLRLQGGSAPFRVSVSGVDAVGAQFDQVIFDANQAPLRLYTRGYLGMSPIGTSDITQAIVQLASSRPTTPSGTNPLFAVMWRSQQLSGDPEGPHDDGSIQHVTPGYHYLKLTPARGQGGGGGIMGTDGFYTVNWCRQETGYYYPNYVNFAIFRNYL